jgi:hypothetical protein
MIAASMVRIGRPKIVRIAVAGMSISFMVILLLKGLIGGPMKGRWCYSYFIEADDDAEKYSNPLLCFYRKCQSLISGFLLPLAGTGVKLR